LWYFTRQLLLLLAASSFQLSSATCPLAAKILVIRPPCITTEACWPSSRVMCFMLAVGGKSVMTGWRVEVILLIKVEYDTAMSNSFCVLWFVFGSSCPCCHQLRCVSACLSPPAISDNYVSNEPHDRKLRPEHNSGCAATSCVLCACALLTLTSCNPSTNRQTTLM